MLISFMLIKKSVHINSFQICVTKILHISYNEMHFQRNQQRILMKTLVLLLICHHSASLTISSNSTNCSEGPASLTSFGTLSFPIGLVKTESGIIVRSVGETSAGSSCD